MAEVKMPKNKGVTQLNNMNLCILVAKIAGNPIIKFVESAIKYYCLNPLCPSVRFVCYYQLVIISYTQLVPAHRMPIACG